MKKAKSTTWAQIFDRMVTKWKVEVTYPGHRGLTLAMDLDSKDAAMTRGDQWVLAMVAANPTAPAGTYRTTVFSYQKYMKPKKGER